MNTLPKTMVDPQNGIHYTLHGDYYLPDLMDFAHHKRSYGPWGELRAQYLKEHRPIVYTHMVLTDTLHDQLLSIDDQSNARYEFLLKRLIVQWGINNELKHLDQMRWVQVMEQIQATARENILTETVLC